MESPTRITVAQYHELIRLGILTADDAVELLDGVLVRRMPKTPRHVTTSGMVRREVGRALPIDCHYQSQQPITLADGEPEPDGAAVRGRIEDYAAAHPGPADVPLVIEVADSSLGRDRGIKLRSDARAGLPVYWIINLTDRQVEVYTEPTTPAEGDPTYLGRAVYRPGEAVPLHLPGRELPAVPVATLLPPPADV